MNLITPDYWERSRVKNRLIIAWLVISRLGTGIEENKYYAPVTGTVLEMTVKCGSGRLELVNVIIED